MASINATLYPGIFRAARAIAVDNGAIHQGRTVGDIDTDLTRHLTDRLVEIDHAGLRTNHYCAWAAIDQWLQGKSDRELATICNGERDDTQAAMVGSPHGADELLDVIFNEVI